MLQEISFHKFKRFREATVPLNRRIVVCAGPNNSGKSSLLQGLAIWEFCRTTLELTRGSETLYGRMPGHGVGFSIDEFTPLALPSLSHLWTNLRSRREQEPDGYTLKINLKWMNETDDRRELEFGLSLANERLFIKTMQSTVPMGEKIPQISFVPAYSGMDAKEPLLTVPFRKRLIGEGRPGAVVRNLLLDIYQRNQESRAAIRKPSRRISQRDLNKLRNTDPWEVLRLILQDTFRIGLSPPEFNQQLHTHIRVKCWRGEMRKGRFQTISDFTPRDLMAEGSGFLQWLTIFAVLLSEETDVVVLDEPDAHLHVALQSTLLDVLSREAERFNKQVVVSTHSTTMLEEHPLESVLSFDNPQSPKFLIAETGRIRLMTGIGESYSPRLRKLQRVKRMLFVENESDKRILSALRRCQGKNWPEDKLVVWPWSSRHPDRWKIFFQFRKDIAGLKAISLVDRDTESIHSVDRNLVDTSAHDYGASFLTRKWRRKQIEAYLLHPDAIARAANCTPDEVIDFVRTRYMLDISNREVLVGQDEPDTLLNANVKGILKEDSDSIATHFHVSPIKIAAAFKQDEVPMDIEIFLDELNRFVQ